MKTFLKSAKNFHHTENLFQDRHFKTKEVAKATSFSHLPERFRFHRYLHQATTTELITPPTTLKIPATKLSANCVKNAFKLSVKNIPIKK